MCRGDRKSRSATNDLRLTICGADPAAQALLLPGALFVAIGAKLFAPLMFVDFCFPSFLQ
jgi:hypothetical protein